MAEAGDDIELVARGHVLDHTRHVGESHVAQCIRAVAAVVQDEAILGADRVEKFVPKPTASPTTPTSAPGCA
jgi:hypothetical protein